jgi:steroid 5-alpha reductase family enzyme
MLDVATLAVPALTGLIAIFVVAIAAWLVSLRIDDVSIVDSLWAVLILLPAACAALLLPAGPRAACVLAMAAVWGARLSGYITWRNWGEGEDHRYRAIRARNEPGFRWKSLYLVFGLQGVLAWVVSAPLLVAVASSAPYHWLDAAGVLLFAVGFLFEAFGDLQLARFRADPASRGKVLDSGLWRYTRHPNYFGEFCIWWGFFLMALAAGGAWTIVSPVLMTILLLRVSGVALLEKDIGERRPAYRDYVARTSAFFPWLPRR